MNVPTEHFIIVATGEYGHFEALNLMGVHAKDYCVSCMKLAAEHVKYFTDYDALSTLYHPNPVLSHDPQYLKTKFVWVIGNIVTPAMIVRDIDYLTHILLDFKAEFGRLPELVDVTIHRYTAFFKVI